MFFFHFLLSSSVLEKIFSFKNRSLMLVQTRINLLMASSGISISEIFVLVIIFTFFIYSVIPTKVFVTMNQKKPLFNNLKEATNKKLIAWPILDIVAIYDESDILLLDIDLLLMPTCGYFSYNVNST